MAAGSSVGEVFALKVRFFGVRGSCPCSSEAQRRYGGNTSCVVLEAPGSLPVVLDLGTGIRAFGEELAGSARSPLPARVFALLTHLHWDHLIGLPFFGPLRHPDTRVEVFGPAQPGGLRDVLVEMLKPPFFPVEVADFAGEVVLNELAGGDELRLGGAKVVTRWVPHVGATLGYRIESGGAAVAFVSDHQRPSSGEEVSEGVLELCDGADLVIHDAQYTPEEFDQRPGWGHSTVEYAVHVAHEAGAKRLALFHHDPSHGDDCLDELLEKARGLKEASSLTSLVAAYEGLSLELPEGL
jgi:phosphoribosyl 1,2-cyclic phosphodiesterase